ncbi:MAG TPA: hypothetical protein VMV94_03490, partial [Phycisphaerae bacterium]|nr:hypothetical protein [Phycisphaerae bacterium]
TVVAVRKPADIPIHSRVRAKGYFIKIRAFQTSAGGTGAGPLLVARSLELVLAPAASLWDRSTGGAGSSRWWNVRSATFWLVPGTAGLAIVWLILRRGARSRSVGESQRVRGPSGQTTPESEGDFDWLTKGDSDHDDAGKRPHGCGPPRCS